MKQELKVPRMGESISEATIGEIFKETGSPVKRDEEILELETDKVNQVIYAPAAGTLTIQVKREDVVRVGDVIGFVETEAQLQPLLLPSQLKRKKNQRKKKSRKKQKNRRKNPQRSPPSRRNQPRLRQRQRLLHLRPRHE